MGLRVLHRVDLGTWGTHMAAGVPTAPVEQALLREPERGLRGAGRVQTLKAETREGAGAGRWLRGVPGEPGDKAGPCRL